MSPINPSNGGEGWFNAKAMYQQGIKLANDIKKAGETAAQDKMVKDHAKRLADSAKTYSKSLPSASQEWLEDVAEEGGKSNSEAKRKVLERITQRTRDLFQGTSNAVQSQGPAITGTVATARATAPHLMRGAATAGIGLSGVVLVTFAVAVLFVVGVVAVASWEIMKEEAAARERARKALEEIRRQALLELERNRGEFEVLDSQLYNRPRVAR